VCVCVYKLEMLLNKLKVRSFVGATSRLTVVCVE
jgi:hypothetical protein